MYLTDLGAALDSECQARSQGINPPSFPPCYHCHVPIIPPSTTATARSIKTKDQWRLFQQLGNHDQVQEI